MCGIGMKKADLQEMEASLFNPKKPNLSRELLRAFIFDKFLLQLNTTNIFAVGTKVWAFPLKKK